MSEYLEFEEEPHVYAASVCWCGGCPSEACSQYKHENKAYTYGAAAMAGIIGMALAIQKNGPRRVERHYWETDPRYYDCWCPGCGAYMKMRDAGVDEGTDDEWCGRCRY